MAPFSEHHCPSSLPPLCSALTHLPRLSNLHTSILPFVSADSFIEINKTLMGFLCRTRLGGEDRGEYHEFGLDLASLIWTIQMEMSSKQLECREGDWA